MSACEQEDARATHPEPVTTNSPTNPTAELTR